MFCKKFKGVDKLEKGWSHFIDQLQKGTWNLCTVQHIPDMKVQLGLNWGGILVL